MIHFLTNCLISYTGIARRIDGLFWNGCRRRSSAASFACRRGLQGSTQIAAQLEERGCTVSWSLNLVFMEETELTAFDRRFRQRAVIRIGRILPICLKVSLPILSEIHGDRRYAGRSGGSFLRFAKLDGDDGRW
jgi:hypothetical protein